MSTFDYKNEALFEHRFWLQILGDHSRFILNALSPEEIEKINSANYFKTLFDNLLQKARMDLSKEELYELNTVTFNAAHQLGTFKLSIICEQLVGKVKIKLPPTFLNHMLNELEEYILILKGLMNESVQLLNPIHYHLVWLPDASGHASSISSSLDMSEKALIKCSRKFSKKFDYLYLKSIEVKGYMRTGVYDFPALHRLNEESEFEIEAFKQFLKDLEKLIIDKKALGQLLPLIPDHMYREECYYITKLSKVSHIKAPDCDAAKPRIED